MHRYSSDERPIRPREGRVTAEPSVRLWRYRFRGDRPVTEAALCASLWSRCSLPICEAATILITQRDCSWSQCRGEPNLSFVCCAFFASLRFFACQLNPAQCTRAVFGAAGDDHRLCPPATFAPKCGGGHYMLTPALCSVVQAGAGRAAHWSDDGQSCERQEGQRKDASKRCPKGSLLSDVVFEAIN